MPITAQKLSALILYLCLLPLLIFCAVMALLILPDVEMNAGLSLLKIYILGMAPAAVLAVALVWYDEKRIERILLIIIILILTGIPLVYQMTCGIWNSGRADLPLGIVIGFPLFCLILAWQTIVHLLRNNDMTYRVRPEAMNRSLGTNGS